MQGHIGAFITFSLHSSSSLPSRERATPPRSRCDAARETSAASDLDRGLNGSSTANPGGIGRNLEQNTTRLAEVDRTEIFAILPVRSDVFRAHGSTCRPFALFRVISNTKGHVMY